MTRTPGKLSDHELSRVIDFLRKIGIIARVVRRMIAARAAAFPTVTFTYTSCFQYSLTSYLRTSSTQVVSSPCRGISRL
jgi:hypothetical protein